MRERAGLPPRDEYSLEVAPLAQFRRHSRGFHASSVAGGAGLDLLLPRRCVVCARLGEDLCPDCRAALPLLLGTHCERCGAPTAWPVRRCRECSGRRLAFASARSAVAYEASVPAVVAAWKERGLRRMAELAADVVADCLACPAADCIAFIPPDGDRSVRRGHHPAERLARELGRRWRLPVVRSLGRTRAASRRSAGSRWRSAAATSRGAFAGQAAGRRSAVVLVDDVYTTGATGLGRGVGPAQGRRDDAGSTW